MQETIPKLFQRVVAEHPEAAALMSKNREGRFVPVSWRELYERVRTCAAGLQELGVRRGDPVGLISENRREWLISDLAVLGLGAADVPRGADSTREELRYILNHADCAVTLAEDAVQLGKILGLHRELPLLKTVIVMDPGYLPEKEKQDGIRVLGFEQLQELGRRRLEQHPELYEREVEPGRGDDLATIIYTSGTTGEPKGVMLSHRNFLYQIEQIPRLIHVGEGDVWLSVLPVWHSFERIMQYVAVGTASTIAYSKPIGKIMLDDMAAVHPTWLASVPRIWEAVRAGVYRNVNAQGGVKKHLFHFFVEVGQAHARFANMFRGRLPQFHRRYRWIDIPASLLPLLLLTPLKGLGSLLVFSKIRHRLGGSFKAGISGGGALPPQVDRFFSGIGVLVLEGYGLTETAPVISVRLQDAPVPNTVGPPLLGTEVRVLDEQGRELAPGEKGVLHVQGQQVMKGYYKRPEETAKVLSADGWLNTGDLALLTHRGEIAIRGRAKDTVVLLGGENVEPEPIEQALTQSEHIDQAMVVGQDQKFLGALVVPNLESLEIYAAAHNIPYMGREDLLETPEIQSLVREQIDRSVCAQHGFKEFERIFRFRLLPEPFRVGEEMTHTLKMKRNVISDKYKKEIDRLFR